MSVKEVPKTYHYECDRCYAVAISPCAPENWSGTPPKWATLRFSEIHKSKQSHWLLCPDCSVAAPNALRLFMGERTA